MGIFREWIEDAVFSRTDNDRSCLVYSKERDKYFWIVNARNWEEIHREAGWYSLVLNDRESASRLLDGTTMRWISTEDSKVMGVLEKARPDMSNRDPDTKRYNTIDAAIYDLSSIF